VLILMKEQFLEEGHMNNQLSCKTAFCTEYELPLKECQAALELWEQKRQGVCRARSASKDGGNELLGLQAHFAKCYALLRKHVDECELCAFVRKVGGQDSLVTLACSPAC
jgi:hypothetical protein